jgi:carbon-monoxide dehydrogenase large subunit
MKIASHLLEVSEDDIEWTSGRAQVKGVPTKGFSLAELAQKATAWNPASALPEGMDFNLDCTHHHQVPGIAFANACHVAVVEIDPGTGKITLKDYVAIHDCGPLINPMIVEGQTVGGVVQGFGGTMSEEILYDADGRLKTSGMMDYLVPVASDIPFIQTGHLETPSPLNPYGFKGAGEGGLTGAPAALANAIEDALLPLGIAIRDDGPFTPRRVLELLKR